MANAVRGPCSPKIILDISQTQSVYTKSSDQDIRSYDEDNVKIESCDYCGRRKGSCLCCRNFVKVMTDPYYDRSPNSDTLPPMNHHYSSPQAQEIVPEGSIMISPGSNNSFISIEELNRKRRRLSVSDYDYEDATGMYVSAPSDCVYENSAKRARFQDTNMNSPGVEMDSETYRKFYSTQYNGHYYQTDPPLMLKPFSGSTETVISIGGGVALSQTVPLECHNLHQQMPIDLHHHAQQQQQQPQEHQPPPVEAALPPMFVMCPNESAQARSNAFKYAASPTEDTMDLGDDYDDNKSVDSSRIASESEASCPIPKTRGRPRTGRVSKKKKTAEKEECSFEDQQQMRVMANVRERQRTQVFKRNASN